ncbi:hypothetical protein TorRG33x02_177350 [Trema orientale]|uniref:Endonuclease/exonuclease/phosphatase n=1 Tax=Trema orientale TaxID=63057 RepID=A0A2P5ELX9_TREOI|nr:hypothetical protein TorRG33x02_177350 [Trema orientale]
MIVVCPTSAFWGHVSHGITKEGVANIQEHLDHFVSNGEWRGILPLARVVHLDFLIESDHRPLLLNAVDHPKRMGGRGTRQFRLKPFWLRKEGCNKVVKDGWQRDFMCI